MRAVFYTTQGEAAQVLQYGHLDTPLPGVGEVRVRLRCSGVNPSDTKSRRGGPNRPMAASTVIPHSDGAGDIDAVGEGVETARIGERVWVWNAQWQRAFGTAAEFVTLPSEQAIVLPTGVGYAEGACLGIPARTALQAVRLAEIGPGKAILIAGGAGAVGNYAVQIAKARGATVLTTVSSAEKAKHAIAAGADYVLNYRDEDVAARVQTLTGGVDAVVEMDLAANANLYPGILKPHARVAIYGTSALESVLPTFALMRNSVQLRMVWVYELNDEDSRNIFADLEALLRAGSLRHNVAQRLPLSEAARAHELVEQGAVIGNVVLDIAEFS
jgi:NADPH2:quinone reductase